MREGRKRFGRRSKAVAALAGSAVLALGIAACGDDDEGGSGGGGGGGDEEVTVGLITKTESNPFFVKMREGAHEAARRHGLRLLTGAGKADNDNASQVTAIENMVAAGARVILITVNDAKAIVPTLRRVRARGVVVIALDSPPDPADAVDALYATDNYQAGLLIGRYARAMLGTTKPRIATLDLFPGHPVGAQRHNGFLKGMGLAAPDAKSTTLGRGPEVACMADTFGNQAKGQAAMESCRQRDPTINVVYTINEPSAAGASKALRAAGRAGKVIVVSVDGGCQGVRDVAAGNIAATAQQYPVKMAQLGVDAAAAFIKSGKKPTGFTDTGVTLIAQRPAPGVGSRDVATGMAGCFGAR